MFAGSAGKSVVGGVSWVTGLIQESSGLMVILVRLEEKVRARACSGVMFPKANLPRMRADLPACVFLLIGKGGGGCGMVSSMVRLGLVMDCSWVEPALGSVCSSLLLGRSAGLWLVRTCVLCLKSSSLCSSVSPCCCSSWELSRLRRLEGMIFWMSWALRLPAEGGG